MRGDIRLQQVTLRDEIVRGLGDLGEVLLAPLVAFFDRSPRIAGLLPLRFRARQRNERALHARHDVGRAGLLVEEIPARVGRDRDAQFRHANARELVAVGIHLRHQNRKRRLNRRRLLRDDALLDEVRAVVGAIGLERNGGNVHGRQFRKLQLVGCDERPLIDARQGAGRRCRAVGDPAVHRHEQVAHRPPVIERVVQLLPDRA